MTDWTDHLLSHWWVVAIALPITLGFLPRVIIHLIVLAYPQDDPRRREYVAEIVAVPYSRRLMWVADQAGLALMTGWGPRLLEGMKHGGPRSRLRVGRDRLTAMTILTTSIFFGFATIVAQVASTAAQVVSDSVVAASVSIVATVIMASMLMVRHSWHTSKVVVDETSSSILSLAKMLVRSGK